MKRRNTLYVLIAVLAIAISGSIGGTLAWLIDSTDEVVNTFTVGNIDITLTETGANQNDDIWEKSYKMVPGDVIEKDPVVTVLKNSEKCYVFLQITESSNLAQYISYMVLEDNNAEDGFNGWVSYDATGYENIYYRIVEVASTDTSFNIIGYQDEEKVTEQTTDDDAVVENKVLVKGSVTKTDMDNLEKEGATLPTLSFKAAAVQFENRTLPQAWDLVKSNFQTTQETN